MPLSHVDENNQVKMVDVGHKGTTKREAIAESRVWLPKAVLSLIQSDEIQSKKGPVFQTAIIAGIQGAKQTSALIPLCHPLSVNAINITIKIVEDEAVVRCSATIEGKTGVEMEALTGASVAALTIYDMCKALT
ncbi:MAG: cyclic pyranopterin monophosphate synthase MoaC, partial [Flavobacteriales bacterium]|nr:cyclic pyranopterin monophosphate synthase MoaC [Flavobacteriales bacterium]